jgi:uncharacterized membrane protein YozB (DUF420 family)
LCGEHVSYLASQINLGLQIAILGIVLVGWVVRKLGHLILHGTLMLAGVALNLVSFLVVMGPSLLSLEILRTQPFHEYSLIALTHAAIGSIALIMGIVIVALWGLRSSPTVCMRRRRVMRVTIVLWTVALVLGIWFYTILYGY